MSTQKHRESINLPFGVVPPEVALDGRLTLTEMRVLLTLFTFRDRDTNVAFPSREAIASRCGLLPHKVSTATTSLVAKGWLVKEGKGGRSAPCHYKITTPKFLTAELLNLEYQRMKTVPESVTVPNSGTVPDSGTKTVPDSGTKTVPDLGRGKEQTNEQTNEQTKKEDATGVASSSPGKTKTTEKPPGITPEDMPELSPDLATEYLTYRKAKRAPLTKRAWGSIAKEIEKSGMSFDEAIGYAMNRGWQGFDASWIGKEKPPAATNQKPGASQQTRVNYDQRTQSRQPAGAAIPDDFDDRYGHLYPAGRSRN